MADYKTPQWLLPNEKNLAYPAAGAETGSGLSEDRHSLYSMDFDGTTNQNINLPTNWVTSLGLSTEMSFSVWVKPDSTSTQMNITSSPYNTWNDNFGIKYIAGSTTLTLEQGSTVKFTNTSTTLSTTSYTHICFVLDAGESSASTKVKCYINGTVVTNENTTSSFTTMLDRSYNFYIGRLYYGAGSSNYTWNGQIDEVAIWNKALNQSEINALSVADAPANIMALSAKPIAYYPLGEQAQMGSANWSFPNGSLQSHVVDFDGSGDEINCGSISQTNEGDISFSAWCNVTATGTYQSILSSTNTSGKAGINIIIRNDGRIKFERNQDISNTRNNTGYNAQGFSFGKWNHLCGTFNSITGELKAYVNGDLQFTSSNTSAGASPTDDLHIGILSDSTNYPANGEISNVVIWNSDQSANIDNIYNNGSPQSTYTATPTAWWKLNAANSSYVYPWTMSITGDPDYTSSNDGCYISSGVLKWRDTGTPAAFTDTFDWYSKEITGANTNITISSTGGEWQGESSSIGLRLFYKIDGGSWVQFQEETHTGGYSPTAWTLTAPAAQSSSSSFQLKVVGFGGASSNSYVTLNDITVTADAGTLYTESFTDADGTGFANGVYTPPPVDWTFIDSSGSNNGESDTLPTSALTPSDLQFESPYSNYSLSFDGADTKLSFSDITLASSYTLSAWAKRTSSSNNEFLFGNDATYGYGAYFNGTTAIYFKQDSGNTTFNNSAITTALARTDWVNWMFVKDSTAGTISIYVDGALAQSVTSALGMTSINTIGGDGTAATSYIWDGNIDEVAIWSSALTQAQVIQVYNNGYPNDLTSLSPSQWWRLGEDAYFVGNDITIPNQITGGQTGTGAGTQTAILVGDAPGSYANGSGTNLAVEDRIGDAPESTANSVSINMIPSNRHSYPAGYLPTQVDNAFSMAFDGTNDYIEIANDTSLQITDNLTLSCWIYADNASGTNSIVDKFYDGADRSYMLRLQSTTIRLSLGNTSGSASVTYQSTATISNGAWYHIATTFSSADNEVKIYINGSLDSTHSKTDLISSNNQPLRIGTGYNLLNYFDGKIDEMAIFNYALSERQVKQDIYEGTTTGKTADLNNISNLTAPVAWYRMGD